MNLSHPKRQPKVEYHADMPGARTRPAQTVRMISSSMKSLVAQKRRSKMQRVLIDESGLCAPKRGKLSRKKGLLAWSMKIVDIQNGKTGGSFAG